jgi:hypothetical protein
MRHPIQLPNYMGCQMEFYTKMSFKNPQIFQQTIMSVFFLTNLL